MKYRPIKSIRQTNAPPPPPIRERCGQFSQSFRIKMRRFLINEATDTRDSPQCSRHREANDENFRHSERLPVYYISSMSTRSTTSQSLNIICGWFSLSIKYANGIDCVYD